MNSFFFGISSYDTQEDQEHLDQLYSDRSALVSCGQLELVYTASDSYTSEDINCQILGNIHIESSDVDLSSFSSPAEKAAHLYDQLQHKSCAYFNGNGIVIIIDMKKEQTLFFRPIHSSHTVYFAQQKKIFISSSFQGLLRSHLVIKKLDPSALSAYVQFGFIPEPLCPITNTSSLLPGYLLIHGDKKLRLKQIQEPQFVKFKKQKRSATLPHLHIDSLVQQIAKLDLPQSSLFFPAIEVSSSKERVNTSSVEVKEDPFRPKGISHLLKHLKPIYSKIYFSTHRKIPSYKKIRDENLVFSHSELKLGLPHLKDAFNDYAFCAKKYYENSLDTLEGIVLHEDRLFAPYLQGATSQQIQEEKAALVEGFMTSAELLDEYITPDARAMLLDIVSTGSLHDLDLFHGDRLALSTSQLWNLFVLEIWFNLHIDAEPSEDRIEAVISALVAKR